MDPNALAPLIPVVAIIAFGVIKVTRMRLEARSDIRDPEHNARLAALEGEMAEVRRQLEETHERLDFTERLLAQHRTEGLRPPA